MDLSRLKEIDLFGRYFLKASEGDRFVGYYYSLNAIRPLIKGNEWLNSVTGFYINVAGGFDAVRLSYFTSSPDQVKGVVDRFVANHGLKSIQNPETPHLAEISKDYGGEELRFRRFLSTYTLIGLDIMEADLLNARCLLATFRWQVMRARRPYKPHFLRTIENQSSFYNSLSVHEKEQFWSDLAHWPNPPQVDWAHFFVNMVLGCDWISQRVWQTFLSRQEPIPIPEINKLIIEQGFQIPQGWHP